MKTLLGKRILVTRAQKQAATLCDALTAEGAQPIPFATIEISPLKDSARLDAALNALADGQYVWVIFTSVNGVDACHERMVLSGIDPQVLAAARVAAIGPATAAALRNLGARVDFVPQEYIAERILDGLGDVAGARILLPRAEMARPALAEALTQAGASVDEVPVYHTLQPPPNPLGLAALRQGVDAITFTSSSTVRHFVSLAGNEVGAALIACIGPITAQTAQSLGLPVHSIARDYTIPGLVQALKEYYAGNRA
jgi:uroporphyrinogen-III synthase